MLGAYSQGAAGPSCPRWIVSFRRRQNIPCTHYPLDGLEVELALTSYAMRLLYSALTATCLTERSSINDFGRISA